MKALNIILIIALFAIFISCNKDSTENPVQPESLLKRKLYLRTPEDQIPNYTIDYEYDMNNKLIRTISGNNEIDSFTWNNNELVNERIFNVNYLGELYLTDSISYTYQNGLLVKKAEYQPWYADPVYYSLYEYSNTKLTKMKEFNYSNFVSVTSYDYSGSSCFRETSYSDMAESHLSVYKLNYYLKNKRIKAELFGFNALRIQTTIYTYDEFGILIKEVCRQPALDAVNPYFYVIRYEYD